MTKYFYYILTSQVLIKYQKKERPIVIDNLILLKRYTTLNELVIKNTLVKNKTIFILMEGFHLSQRQISLQKQPPEVF